MIISRTSMEKKIDDLLTPTLDDLPEEDWAALREEIDQYTKEIRGFRIFIDEREFEGYLYARAEAMVGYRLRKLDKYFDYEALVNDLRKQYKRFIICDDLDEVWYGEREHRQCD